MQKSQPIYPVDEAIEILIDKRPPTIYILSTSKRDTIDIIDIAIRLRYFIFLRQGPNVYGLKKIERGGDN